MWRLKISEGGGQRIVWLMYRNEDGGWGFNVLDESAMFGTCLNYVTLRLLGQVQKDENDGLAKGRSWILSHGTATAAPQWAKILLSVLGVYDWSGNRPVIPELCLVPRFLPIHPGSPPKAGPVMVNNDEARNASSARRRPRRRRPLAGREEMDASDLEKLRAWAESPRLRRAIEDPHNRRTKPGDGPALDQGQLSSCNPL
ncbi:hypothetical protein PVAP13_8KG202500 [Panicum virgatum]|uniref:Squalene cyclase N-terminal domain-containing protein n=1 Tax=Panicum virgatum TaxID=38727 RepID=A0A8T0PJC4_PANVG|nr:hypothetical protein PVAP13_8KG202500 [Panicum virgatum]